MSASAAAELPLVTQPQRMRLNALVKGKLKAPIRCLLYGTEGVGKSTFASQAPAPIFLGAEDGTAQLDVTRFPAPETWVDVLDAIRELTQEKHGFETLVIDTLDWAEPLLWRHICARDKKADIEDYGYGKGYVAALDEWRIFIAALERLRKAKGMHVLPLAHCQIKPFKNPEGEDFDRYEMKLHTKAAGLIKEWCDAVLFANYEVFAHRDDKTKRVRGVDTGSRLVFTQRRAAYDAKNRYNLPEAMPLAWSEFIAAVNKGETASPDVLRNQISAKAKDLGPELEKKTLESLSRAGEDAKLLAQLHNWVIGKLAQENR